MAIKAEAAQAKTRSAVTLIGEKLGIDPPDFDNVVYTGGADVVALQRQEIMAEYLATVAEVMPKGRRKRAEAIPGTVAQMNGQPGEGIQLNPEDGIPPAQRLPEAEFRKEFENRDLVDGTDTIGGPSAQPEEQA